MLTERVLSKDVGYFGLLAMYIGINIGPGLFVVLNVAAELSGGWTPVALALLILPLTAALLVYRSFTAAFPTMGATFTYMSLASNAGAFVAAGAVILVGIVGALPVTAMATGVYLEELVDFPPTVVAALTLVALWIVNIIGIRLATQIQAVLMISLVLALGFYVGGGVSNIELANLGGDLPQGGLGFLAAVTLMYPLAAGGFFVAEFGGEVRDAHRTLPRVLTHGLVAVFALYLVIAVVTFGVVPSDELVDGTLVTAARSFMGTGPVAFFVIAGAMAAAVTTANALYASIARILARLGTSRVLPEALAKTHPRFETPHVALTVGLLGALLGLITISGLAFLAVVVSLGVVLVVAMVCWASIRAHAQKPYLFEGQRGLMGPRPVKLAAYFVVGLSVPLSLLLIAAVPVGGAVFVGLLATTLVYYRLRVRGYLQELEESLPFRLQRLAQEDPDAPAITCGDTTLTRKQVEDAADALARDLAALGVGRDDYVAIVLPNCLEHPIATIAAWKLGAVPLALSPSLSSPELRELVTLTDPAIVLGLTDPSIIGNRPSLPADHPPTTPPDGAPPLPDAISPAWKAVASGGSTGRPKVIRAAQPAIYREVAGLGAITRTNARTTALIPVPLAHNTGSMLFLTLLEGGHVVITEKFDPEGFLQLVDRHRVTWVIAVPTMMTRIMKLPDEALAPYDVSSIEIFLHGAAPCPPEVKEYWLRLLGPKKVVEAFACAESQAITFIDGAEWLGHRGSVGRPVFGEMEIRDHAGAALPAGSIGHIWMRPPRSIERTYEYLGASAQSGGDGWETVGDMGWLDDAGYLYLADREGDMMLVGGANVYPAEIEAAIIQHPAVLDACVIGLPDEDLGTTPHAIVETADALDEAELAAFVEERVAKYKRPHSYEFTTEPVRDGAGKVRRAALISDRR